ncbi:glycosyltransferase family 32 protein [Clostridium perfringens]|uniref:glycosyltransferase family 32 protein n=1 Tax=Clostridium perfringens TaxID=1502 RepID=UPI001094B588|nr:glycosyltransferase [Clostridium perfringens]MDK0908200.1 glycosyltransferase [Clostridium perfringens]TGY46119.1 glycosyl transferase [Clostridium perfringens]HAT4180129.1 glycosyl transferase [Clostridium perfringens]
MIPKKIHYCWFGGNPIPEKDKKCIESWKKMCPDYEIIEWNESNYDLTRNKYMQAAYKEKKLGFVPDYARLDIIYNNGGIYLDTDVELIKNLDELLSYKAVFGFESDEYVNLGQGFAAEKNNELILKLRDMYNNIDFYNEDGSFNLLPSPSYSSAGLSDFGFIMNGQEQEIEGQIIKNSECFCPKNYYSGKLKVTKNTYSIHWFNASWQTNHQKRMLKLRRLIGRNNYDKLVRIKNKIYNK